MLLIELLILNEIAIIFQGNENESMQYVESIPRFNINYPI